MERTNHFGNAKKLLAEWARTTALAIVPLLTAVSAHAAGVAYPILPIGNLSCGSRAGAGACTGNVGDSSSPSPVNGVYGVSFFTTNGGIDFTNPGGSPFIVITAGGSLDGTLPTNIPVFWDFTLSSDGSLVIDSWSLGFSLGTTEATNNVGQFTTIGSPGGTFSGTGSITTSGSPTTLYETIVLEVNTNGGTGDLFITAPFNFGSAPEPASAGLLAAGLGILAWLGRRSKSGLIDQRDQPAGAAPHTSRSASTRPSTV
jgi:hypothetical protein